MTSYENVINEIRYMYFYDNGIKSWTVMQIDKNENQISNAEYYANKKSLLKDYKFDFKNKIK
jgi:hypothetical protein